MPDKTKKLQDMTSLEAQQFILGAPDLIKDINTKFRLSKTSIDPDVRRSTTVDTGMLMTNLVLSGGIYPGGWYTFLGGEGSCKSTHMMQVLGMVFSNDVPLVFMWDYEGSVDAGYMQNIFGDKLNIQKLFGVEDLDNPGTWIIPPRIDYHAEDIGELFYRSMGRMLKQLPDKFYDKGNWYLGYDNTKENISRFSEENCKKFGFIKDRKLSKAKDSRDDKRKYRN